MRASEQPALLDNASCFSSAVVGTCFDVGPFHICYHSGTSGDLRMSTRLNSRFSNDLQLPDGATVRGRLTALT
ncbi:hypothetical protein CLOM_g12297 [Closterium sp. NIES-68]|nr:hypothetical protein CLOM_g4990 [Closterium sp. NIES-68]GJP53129.1 hypothetical protein CLOM_g12297 [Closterium sp. NIES-68]GJP61960.1 hypothetical protein CLOP_g19077 [Closterium sp. NIES-67]